MKKPLNPDAVADFDFEEFRKQIRANLSDALGGNAASVVCRHAGLNESALRDILHGRSGNPGIVTLKKISLAMGASLSRDILPERDGPLRELALLILQYEEARERTLVTTPALVDVSAQNTARDRMLSAARKICLGES